VIQAHRGRLGKMSKSGFSHWVELGRVIAGGILVVQERGPQRFVARTSPARQPMERGKWLRRESCRHRRYLRSTRTGIFRLACIARRCRMCWNASVKARSQRCAVADRLNRIYHLAFSTGQLARFVVFGSFVTTKSSPNDVDVILLMEDTFDLASVTGEPALVFQHMEADAHFGASVFWTKRSGALGGEQAMIEYWQARREGGRRGIVEIVEEGS